jgi:riboflavin biosynthesis pyrimidine reductase
LAGVLVEADLIDAFVWLIAPGLMGAGIAALPPLASPRRLNVSSVEHLGEDLKIEGTVDVHRNR